MPGIGLAYKTPEQESASNFDANARAVSQPSADPGIGMAATPVAPVEVAAPPAQPIDTSTPTVAPAPAPEKPKPLIDFHENPLGAIGLVLSSAVAGFEGKESPVDQLRKNQLEQQAQQYRTASLALDVLDKTSVYVGKLPVGQRKAAIEDFGTRFGPALGGLDIKPILTAFSDGSIANGKAKLQAAAQFLSPQALAVYANDPAGLDKLLTTVLEKKATQETPEEAAAKAGAVAKAQNAAGADKPMTPAEIAANKISAANAGTSAASLKETQRHNTVEETNSAPGNKPLSESMVRNKMLHGQSVPQQKILNENGVWDALSAGSNAPARVVGAFGGGDALGGEKYKRGVNAVRHIVANNIYSVSGASAPESEVERQLSLALPNGTDSKKVRADKRARLDEMVESMRVGSVGGRSGDGGSDDPLGIRGK